MLAGSLLTFNQSCQFTTGNIIYFKSYVIIAHQIKVNGCYRIERIRVVLFQSKTLYNGGIAVADGSYTVAIFISADIRTTGIAAIISAFGNCIVYFVAPRLKLTFIDGR